MHKETFFSRFRYVSDTLNSFFNQLTPEGIQYGYFQQDNPCTARAFQNEITHAVASVSEDIWKVL
jgi:hypothetical protein